MAAILPSGEAGADLATNGADLAVAPGFQDTAAPPADPEADWETSMWCRCSSNY